MPRWCQRHRPEQTLLYQLVEHHCPAFVENLPEAGKQLPTHARHAFDGYLPCGRLEHGFLRLRCDTDQFDLGEALDTDDPMPDLSRHAITYRIAVGPHRGRKAFNLQTLPDNGWYNGAADAPGNVAGFSLHTGVAVKNNQREKLERLCRYICRPPVSEKRLFLTARGDIGLTLKPPYRDGTTHVIFEPLDLIARLAALVPPPGRNLTGFHGG